MENQKVEKVKKVSAKKIEPKIVTLTIGRVILKKDKFGLTYYIPQAFTGTQLVKFIEDNKGLIEAFRNA